MQIDPNNDLNDITMTHTDHQGADTQRRSCPRWSVRFHRGVERHSATSQAHSSEHSAAAASPVPGAVLRLSGCSRAPVDVPQGLPGGQTMSDWSHLSWQADIPEGSALREGAGLAEGTPPPSSAHILEHQASSQVYVLAVTGFPGKNGQLFHILLLAASSRLFFCQDFSQVPEEGKFIYEANPFPPPGLFWAVQGETPQAVSDLQAPLP
uniref:Uncharacterized protein n=1 Tax=Pipistrellus kuhlii TaxID=59472 RepID=A0A7J7RGF8_PIPKU|nr:hypothetical protein mPipKuh1_010556 [Pipistrellus kuhlii]